MKILKRAAAVAVFLMGLTACSDSDEYVQEAVTAPSPFHGIHGITVTKDGKSSREASSDARSTRSIRRAVRQASTKLLRQGWLTTSKKVPMER